MTAPVETSEPAAVNGQAGQEQARRVHAMAARDRAKTRWAEAPRWARRGTKLAAVVGGTYAAWAFVVSPTLDNAARDAANAGVAAVFAEQSEPFVNGVLAEVDKRVAAARDDIGPVVVAQDPLAWLPCQLSNEARGLVGGDPQTGNKTLNPARSTQLANAIRDVVGQMGVESLRVTLTADGGLRVTNQAGVGAPLCAPKQPAAPAPTATTAPATPVTPPPAAN